MISDKERRRVAKALREPSELLNIRVPIYEALDMPPDVAETLVSSEGVEHNNCRLLNRLADLIEPQTIDGDTSDGYHTFNELYHHRAVLFSVIVAKFADRAWKSKLHADGTMYEGMFIVGIETPDGQATYHYDVDPYWEMFRCKETDRAPEWDGHTPDQAIERIGKLADLIDRPTTTRHGKFKTKYGRKIPCCEVCGYSIGDMRWGYCPKCGAEVVE